MDARSLILGVAVITTLIAGCSANPVALRPEATGNIKKVALITVSEPPACVANDFGSPGMMLGGIGGAVAGV